MTFILDMGSGNTCQNDTRIIERMIREIAEIDKGVNKVILKWQLFNSAPPNIPLTHESFKYAYDLAERLCFETTSSVFDLDSMRYLMQFNVPFVKIANRPDLYELEKHSTVPVYISTSQSGLHIDNAVMMACVSKYPADIEDYEKAFNYKDMEVVSDHTVGWGLTHKYFPRIIEKHYVHERLPNNPDAGLFAVTQIELDEVINA
jgi:sialic acid synthase SpsE